MCFIIHSELIKKLWGVSEYQTEVLKHLLISESQTGARSCDASATSLSGKLLRKTPQPEHVMTAKSSTEMSKEELKISYRVFDVRGQVKKALQPRSRRRNTDNISLDRNKKRIEK